MKIFLKTLKYLGYSIAGFIAFLLLYLLSAAVLSRIAVNTEEVSQKEETIWLLSNGAHTDIVMPVKNDFCDWQTIVSQQDTRGKGESRYIALGWGCRKFYLETPTWADLKFTTAFRRLQVKVVPLCTLLSMIKSLLTNKRYLSLLVLLNIGSW